MTERRHSSPVLREPLGAQLDDGLGEPRIKEMWERIDHAPQRSRKPWLLLALAAAVSVALLIGVSRFSPRPEPRQLALVSGTVPSVLGNELKPSLPHFDDGSSIGLSPGSRLEVLRNDARSFVTALRRGDATFDVKPGGPRHWVVEAGELSVEVVGTHFRVERGADATKVSVDHGIVMVRGERVPGGSVQLTAGEKFELSSGSASSPPEPSAVPPALDPAPTPARLSPPKVEAPSAAGAASAEPSTPDPVELALRAADLARRQGDGAAALRHFNEAFEQAPAGDTRRGLAGLSLARLLMASDPVKAAQILRSSLPAMPQALLEDAAVRLVEAESRAGHPEAAARAAEDYRRRFPAGRRADEVRRWSEP